jgi:hypothetical protein
VTVNTSVCVSVCVLLSVVTRCIKNSKKSYYQSIPSMVTKIVIVLYRDGGTCWNYRPSHLTAHNLLLPTSLFPTTPSVLQSFYYNQSSHASRVDYRTLACHANSRTVPYSWRSWLSTGLLCPEAGCRLSLLKNSCHPEIPVLTWGWADGIVNTYCNCSLSLVAVSLPRR